MALTRFPTTDEYLAVLSQPTLAFQDSELRAGRAVLGTLGYVAANGQFACVVPMEVDGSRKAVRFFTRDAEELWERYDHFRAHLTARPVAACVGFDFLRMGVRVEEAWYPVLKMDWVKGAHLHEAVGRLVRADDRDGLQKLARDWAATVQALHAAGIAHGDLQHGNVLVADGALRLIDFDGMYVPTLRGRKALELGHPNYQHPARTAEHFDETLDHFSALAIYLSLHAVAQDPSYWTDFHGNPGSNETEGEHILFEQADYSAPGASARFEGLRGSGDEQTRRMTEKLAEFCLGDPEAVPPLERLLPKQRTIWAGDFPDDGWVPRATPPAQPTPGKPPATDEDEPASRRSETESAAKLIVSDWISTGDSDFPVLVRQPAPQPTGEPGSDPDPDERPSNPLVLVLLVLGLVLGGLLAYVLWQSQRQESEHAEDTAVDISDNVAIDYGDVIGESNDTTREDSTWYGEGIVDTTMIDGVMEPEIPVQPQQTNTPSSALHSPRPPESSTTNAEHLVLVQVFFDCEASINSSCMSGLFADQVRLNGQHVSFGEMQNQRDQWIERWPQRTYDSGEVRSVTGSDGVVTLRIDYLHRLSNSRRVETARMWAELDIARGGPYGYYITGQRGGKRLDR